MIQVYKKIYYRHQFFADCHFEGVKFRYSFHYFFFLNITLQCDKTKFLIINYSSFNF